MSAGSSQQEASETQNLGEALGRWVEEVEQMLGAEVIPPPWMREPPAPIFGQQEDERLPIVDARSVAAGVFDTKGRLVAETPFFARVDGRRLVDRQLLAEISMSGEPIYREISGPGEADRACLVAAAPGRKTATWRLPREIHEAAQALDGAVVVITTVLDREAAPLRDACFAYGLTGLQTRVALEVVRVGAIKDAAENLELSYQTAREALAGAMKRVGARKLPALVTRLTTLAFGVFPGRASSGDVLADVWGLSERQITIAGMLIEGVSRDQAARLLGISLSLVKKEMDTVYSVLQVASSAALARKIVEARAMGWLTATTAGGAGFVEDNSEPLRLALRADGGRIAFSDYGPASGTPVLILHSSMTTRLVSRKLLRALHREGYRPIAIDRPGFGLTDPIVSAYADPFEAATSDVSRVLEHLKIRRVDVVSRGAAQFLVALAKAVPDALGEVVLVNPGPPYRFSGRSLGPLGVIKDALVRNPASVRMLAPFLASQLTYERLSKMMVQWTRGSPPDEAAVRDPEIVADFFRSVRMFATGRFEGFLDEQAAISRAGKPPQFAGASGWRVLLGANDVLYEPRVVLAYWQDLLPGAQFRVVEDGGRFVAMTHPHLVVAALSQSAPW